MFDIPFNKPHKAANEIFYIQEVLNSGNTGSLGRFTFQCEKYFEEKYGFRKCILTNSCTTALEMISVLLGFQIGDEIIAPSYTYVSSVNPFLMRGAKVVFADSRNNNPNIDADRIEELITPKTKAVLVMHYAGMGCEMRKIEAICKRNNLFLIEDAAQCVNSYYDGRALGSFGDFGTLSFHETKNISCGEGGMLMINNPVFIKRAEMIREMGTNKRKFIRGEVSKYEWMDIGSSCSPSEITAAYLFAQLEDLEYIQMKRIEIWTLYYEQLKILAERGLVSLPILEQNVKQNAHIFYIVCQSKKERDSLIENLKTVSIQANFHYQTLSNSIFYTSHFPAISQPFSERFSDCLVRLPLYDSLSIESAIHVIETVKNFYNQTTI